MNIRHFVFIFGRIISVYNRYNYYLIQLSYNMIVILDNGHGVNTPGKCSPDKRLLEYKYAREIVSRIHEELQKENIKSYILTPEEEDISLRERVARANAIYKDNNKQAILISIHCNAAGADGKWHSAKGWSVFLSQNASKKSKHLADCLADSAQSKGLKMRYSRPNQSYWVQNLAICRDTHCPAVLTENLFQDNKEDVEYLLSEEGKETIAQLHVDGILKYING